MPFQLQRMAGEPDRHVPGGRGAEWGDHAPRDQVQRVGTRSRRGYTVGEHEDGPPAAQSVDLVAQRVREEGPKGHGALLAVAVAQEASLDVDAGLRGRVGERDHQPGDHEGDHHLHEGEASAPHEPPPGSGSRVRVARCWRVSRRNVKVVPRGEVTVTTTWSIPERHGTTSMRCW